jgi:hypothetical protein
MTGANGADRARIGKRMGIRLKRIFRDDDDKQNEMNRYRAVLVYYVIWWEDKLV